MITILHGEDTVKSRQALDSLKAQGAKREVLVLDGNKSTLTDLLQALESRSLFGQERLVILENFLSGRKKSKEQENITAYLKDREQEIDLIFWEEKELNRLICRLFPKAQVKVFKLDPSLFRFLDSLKPGNQKVMIESFRQAQTQEEVNLIFYMLIRQFRLFLFLKSGGEKGIDEIDRMAPWQKTKIARQTQLFTDEKLISVYHQLLEIDDQEKSGLASSSLTQTLELFLANL